MTNGPTKYFILVYDMSLRHVDVLDFDGDMERANAEYARIEEEHSASGTYEVVLVGADSIETIKRTHSPYFSTGSAAQVVEDFIASI